MEDKYLTAKHGRGYIREYVSAMAQERAADIAALNKANASNPKLLQPPAPDATDAQKWEQYAALCLAVPDPNNKHAALLEETEAARVFKEKYLTP